MYTCAHCTERSCELAERNLSKAPKNCPMRNGEKLKGLLENYKDEQTHRFYSTCSATEAEGYCVWPRLRETAEFCKKMGYKKIGLAFCGGLRQEARIVADVLSKHGLEVVSVVCKVGGFDKGELGLPDSCKIHPGQFEPTCNPITQAELLNEQNTEFNVVLGLCVGHDSLFYANSKAPVTTLVAKDRVLGNNPAAAIYTANTYCKNKLV